MKEIPNTPQQYLHRSNKVTYHPMQLWEVTFIYQDADRQKSYEIETRIVTYEMNLQTIQNQLRDSYDDHNRYNGSASNYHGSIERFVKSVHVGTVEVFEVERREDEENPQIRR